MSLGFLRLIKHLCLYIRAPNTYVDTLVSQYMIFFLIQ